MKTEGFRLAALADEAVEYRIETTYASEDYPDSEYQGWPNAHKDKLWNKYEGMSLVIPTLSIHDG